MLAYPILYSPNRRTITAEVAIFMSAGGVDSSAAAGYQGLPIKYVEKVSKY